MSYDDNALMQAAVTARENAYAPYSGFWVGAAVLAEDGEVYTGCNVENASYGLSICAERTAILKAVSNGNRKIKAIAIAGGHKDGLLEHCTPCGACRQVMQEFGGEELVIVLHSAGGEALERRTQKQLLPEAFSL